MYTLPYVFDEMKNKLSIAIVDENQKINEKFCRKMIVDKELATPKVFYDEINPVEVKSDQFHVIGTMGNSHHCEIKIIFMPIESECESIPGTPAKEELITLDDSETNVSTSTRPKITWP